MEVYGIECGMSPQAGDVPGSAGCESVTVSGRRPPSIYLGLMAAGRGRHCSSRQLPHHTGSYREGLTSYRRWQLPAETARPLMAPGIQAGQAGGRQV